MNYSELIQAYFERSVALQWYWTIYVLVIGGLLGLSTLRHRPEFLTTVLVTILFACFAFKNEGAIEATVAEREAIRSASTHYPNGDDAKVKLVREKLGPVLTEYDMTGARYFHWACSLLTIALVWAKEWRRRTATNQGEHHHG